MRKMLFPALAFSGIKKNRKLYTPYVLSCTGSVMISYIMQSLSYSPLLHSFSGGGELEFILSLGKFVIAAFSLLFLFYTNSFLIRRRNREFGLYSILGMNRRSISAIMAWESLIIALTGLAGGIGLGVLFSKLAELGLLKIIRADTDFTFRIQPEAVTVTLMIYGIIFGLLFVKSLIQVRAAKPIALLHSENTGEKPPKANWVFAAAGALILGAAYYLSVTIESPLTALVVFFAAVLMVIAATYLIFISGSVALCRILQKKKKYYYKKNHFVSVSSMKYRMKRNGAGLASICILCTMVLVMISSTSSLYFGANDMIAANYDTSSKFTLYLPDIDSMNDGNLGRIRAAGKSVFERHQVTPENETDYRFASISGELKGTRLNLEVNTETIRLGYDSVRMVYFVSQDDYNARSDKKVSLSGNECLLYTSGCGYEGGSLSVGELTLDIRERTDSIFNISEMKNVVMPSFVLVVPDYETLLPLEEFRYESGDPYIEYVWHYGYDLDAGEKETADILGEFKDAVLGSVSASSRHGTGFNMGNVYSARNSFFSTFGGLFFIAVVLSLMFIFAAVTIIYYKQISEGYEDRGRFEIMQKVGMTSRDIKKSINSQILTVFFAPLVFSALHLAFAFPMIWKMLTLFGLRNMGYALAVTATAFVLFGVFYAAVYKITARSYYAIVSSRD